MALDFNDLKVEGYRRLPQPFPISSPVSPSSPDQKIEALRKYIEEEFRRLEKSLETLVYAAPQVAVKEPDKKQKGLIRYAKSPWDPLGTGDAWVYWDGSAWTAL